MAEEIQPTPRSAFVTRRLVIGTVVIIILAALFSVLGFGLTNNDPVTGNSGATRVEKPASDFSFETFDGGTFRLSDHLGKPVVVNFWASWCPPCRDEAQVLEQAWRTYGSQDVVFVGVDIQEDATTGESDARAFLAQYGVTYPNGMDDNGSITIDYGVIGLPVTFFIDKNGVVARRWVGAITAAQLDLSVQALLAGKSISGGTAGENLDEFYEFGQPSQ
ncbi:MAG: TlpA disulfide reductase family protein [Chloroflexi bacterium]|nr:TlpA disulfide reductase family protein [Chloroflexota bacterium]